MEKAVLLGQLRPVGQLDLAPAGPEAGEAKPGDAAGAPIKAREKRPEQYWRTRARDLQTRLDRVVADAAVLASRLQALAAGPETPAVLQERTVTASALNRRRGDETALRAEIAAFEARAASENVPADWIR